MMRKRTPMLEAIRAEEARIAERAHRAMGKALRLSEQGRVLRADAGNAGWLGRRVRLWIAHRLERKAARILGALMAARRLAKVDEAPQGGHRSARRRLDRESS